MVIEFKPKSDPVVIATLPPGKVTRETVQKAIDEHFAAKPMPPIKLEVPASVMRTKAFKALEAEGIVRKVGRPATGKAKKALTIRLDQDVATALESREDWRNEVNTLLRKHLGL